MSDLVGNETLIAKFARELLNDERVLAAGERALLFDLLNETLSESTGNADLDAAVSRRLIAAAIGSVSGRILNALADEWVRQLLARHGVNARWPDPRGEMMKQVSPTNPGNAPGIQVSPSNPGNDMMKQVSPTNPGGPSTQVSPSNPGNEMMKQVSPTNPGNAPGIQVSPSNPGNDMRKKVLRPGARGNVVPGVDPKD